jgi:hypothetical protein
MRVLYISYDGMTDALGRSQVIPYLLGLAGKGHDIHILSSEKAEAYQQGRREVEALLSAHGIGWTPLGFSSRPPMVSKLFDIYSLRKAARRLQQQHDFHIVHCRSYIAAFAGLELKRRFGVRFVFDMRGFWADERVEGNIWKLSNPFLRFTYRYFKKQEKQFFSQADAVISLTHTGKSILKEKFGEDVAHSTSVIPCCTDLELFSPFAVNPEQRLQLQQELGIGEDDFVLSYLGSIGTWYMTREMLAFFRRLLLKKTNARFLFITGEPSSLIMKEAAAAGIPDENIRVVKAQRKQVPAYLSLSDFSIFFIKPVFSKKASSPTKQGEIMSMGIPFITNTGIGDTDRIVKETGAGILVKEFSDEPYDNAISQMDAMLKLDPGHIRQCATNHFNLEHGVNEYHRIYQSLVRESDK